MIEEIREALEDNTVGGRPLCILSKPSPVIEDLPDEDWKGADLIRIHKQTGFSQKEEIDLNNLDREKLLAHMSRDEWEILSVICERAAVPTSRAANLSKRMVKDGSVLFKEAVGARNRRVYKLAPEFKSTRTKENDQ